MLNILDLGKVIDNVEDAQRGLISVYKVDNELHDFLDNGLYSFYLGKKEIITKEEAFDRVSLNIPKIPFKYFSMVTSFYKAVYTKHRTEATVLFYWNIDNKEMPAELYEKYKDGLILDGNLIVVCPKQSNSSARTTFNSVASPDELMSWLELETKCILETHSHHNMPAFWSGTDNANEKHNHLRLFSVFGKICTTEDIKTRVCFLGNYVDIDDENLVFDMGENIRPYPVGESHFPDTWWNMIGKTHVAYTTYKPYNHYSVPTTQETALVTNNEATNFENTIGDSIPQEIRETLVSVENTITQDEVVTNEVVTEDVVTEDIVTEDVVTNEVVTEDVVTNEEPMSIWNKIKNWFKK